VGVIASLNVPSDPPATDLHRTIRASQQLAPATKDLYLKAVTDFCRSVGGNPQDWTKERAQSYYTQLLDRVRPNTAAKMMMGVQYAARGWAQRHRGVDFTDGIVIDHRPPPIRERVLTPEQVVAILGAALPAQPHPEHHRNVALLTLLLATGARRSGVAEIRSAGFRQRRGVHSVQIGTLWIPLAPSAVDVMRPYRDLLRAERLTGPFLRRIIPELGGRQAHLGAGLSTWGIWMVVRDRARAGADLPNVSPHAFRDTLRKWLDPHTFSDLEHGNEATAKAVAAAVDAVLRPLFTRAGLL